MLDYVLNLSLLALGFGFVIFWHELGHFLAAKYVGIKVEQFAVGFGQALFSWRKGMGITFGSSGKKYQDLIDAEKDGVHSTNVKAIGETEYRLNWIPLGGYVKMLGQDDMNPNAVSADPRAYPQKSVGARMLVISAGVIMNIILAAVMFMGLFMMGHKVPPAVIGGIMPGSPAQRVTQLVNGKTVTTSLAVGDQILELDGTKQDDWTKVGLTSALADASEPTSIRVQHVDGKIDTYQISPERDLGQAGSRGFLVLGIEQPRSLKAPEPKKEIDEAKKEAEMRALVPADYFALKAGDKIVGVDGQVLNPDDPRAGGANDYYKLDRAVQTAGREGGRPVELRVQRKSGAVESVKASPKFLPWFGKESLNFAGMLPRTSVAEITADSPAKKSLQPGDIVAKIVAANDPVDDPTFEELTSTLNRAGQAGQQVELTVIRGDKRETLKLDKFIKVSKEKYGLGFAAGYDTANPVVAGTLKDSPAAKAGVPNGATITAVNGTAVKNWFEIQTLLADAPLGQPVQITATKDDKPATFSLTLGESHRDAARNSRYSISLALTEQIMVRQAANPAKAAWLGVTETRDFILQFYVTIRRMFDGSVSYTNLMGPLGIFQSGTLFAARGMDWLIWFLAMISANLAVVNFLPIPVVDGGHFVFLMLEKIQGKPVSQRVQSIAQVVGLALLLGVFLLVTYQDISRMISPS